jgi:diaminohydroxyphosphoribosylaminopyrimidine deaminase / 5-amino-6-(5-phosphoribosylamino)uracil reductase
MTTINPEPDDERRMREAARLSKFGFPAPNPHVGCLIVQGEEIVGEGFHAAAGTPHAERVALAKAGDLARGATAYVTLEPCRHHGRTPPCTQALIEAGIERVVYALADPNPLACGGAVELQAAGIRVDKLDMNWDARFGNRIWMHWMEHSIPYVTLKIAESLDGFVARLDRKRVNITSDEQRLLARAERGRHGAVLVGRTTIETDDPILDCREIDVPSQPLRVILDPHARLGDHYRVFRENPENTMRVVAVPPQKPWDWQCPMVDGKLDLVAMLQEIGRRGIIGVYVDGGPATVTAFYEAGIFDEIQIFGSHTTELGEGIRLTFNPYQVEKKESWYRLCDSESEITPYMNKSEIDKTF